MAIVKEIKRKIWSIKNTWKITKVMSLISTVKMKKAQDLAIEKREFVLEIFKVFLRIEKHMKNFPLFHDLNWKKTLAIIITSNKWLCWGYNINVMKKVNSYIKESWEKLEFISLWKKAANFIIRTWNKLIADFSSDFTDNIEPLFTKRISKMMRDEFSEGKYSKVVVFYNHYINTVNQIPVVKPSLPINANIIKDYLTSILEGHYDLKELDKNDDVYHYDIEPTPKELANEVIPIILDMIFYYSLLEAKASEHSARMIAMKNAKDNANKIVSQLTLKYNKARQTFITREVSEIIAWVESLKDS